jgi:4-hydroxy-tetrahydrodipicolinate reductase
MNEIRVAVAGVCGRMGQLVAQTVSDAPDLLLVAGVDPVGAGADLGERVLGRRSGMTIESAVGSAISRGNPQVMVDFTTPAAVLQNARQAISRQVACVIGTTGLADGDLGELARLCDEHQTPSIVAPNFSIGACLMMRFAEEAANRYEYGQIIEMHHPGKKDAPSGTALMTARRIAEARDTQMRYPQPEHVGLAGALGGQVEGIGVHAARMDGVVADQKVIFGGPGETLSIEQRTTSRECFMPGVLLAVRQVLKQKGLVVGLEKLL